MIPADLVGAPYLRELARRLRKHAVKMGGWDRQAGKEIRDAAVCIDVFAGQLEKETEERANYRRETGERR